MQVKVVIAFFSTLTMLTAIQAHARFEKLNKGSHVCFGAAGNHPAIVTYTGKAERIVNAIKLVHKSGQVSCDGKNYSPWGCSLHQGISVVVTDRYNSIIYPDNVKPIKLTHAKRPLHVSIRSEGCDDPGRNGGCGTAYIRVSGRDYSLHKRGFNVVVLDRKTGTLIAVKTFDTHAHRSEALNAYNYLKSLTGDKIVLAAIQDEAWNHGKHYPIDQELMRLGATGPIIKTIRSSLALVGYTGSKANARWVKFVQNQRYKGPSSVTAQIPMTGVSLNYWYKLVGSNSHSKSLLFANVANPFLLRQGRQIKIWYGEDYTGSSEFNNKGHTCVDVYALFA